MTCESSVKVIDIYYNYIRMNDRVKKRALTTFERDQIMSNIRTQIDYQVDLSYIVK